MIDLDEYLRELEEEDDREIKDNEAYQKALFEEYVLRGSEHWKKREELNRLYQAGEELFGEKGLRKQLAAFDLAYFGRAYLPHYFIRQSPAFHGELDDIWRQGVIKGLDPYTDAKTIARKDGSRQL